MQEFSSPYQGLTGLLGVEVGADADSTVFDPETVQDNSELAQDKNALPTTRVPYVMVNGTIVVKDREVLRGVCHGQAISNGSIA